jgi:hypothetical protein
MFTTTPPSRLTGRLQGANRRERAAPVGPEDLVDQAVLRPARSACGTAPADAVDEIDCAETAVYLPRDNRAAESVTSGFDHRMALPRKGIHQRRRSRFMPPERHHDAGPCACQAAANRSAAGKPVTTATRLMSGRSRSLKSSPTMRQVEVSTTRRSACSL